MSDQWSEIASSLPMDRRTFFRGAAASIPLAYTFFAGGEIDAAKEQGGLIVREKVPENLEFPFATLNSFITPNDKFFVRNHFPIPKVDQRTWRLKVSGAVKKELELSYDALRKMKSKTVVATLECSGNGRAFLTPKAKGVPWQLGAVGNARWTGVPLSDVLEKAGVKRGAVEVILEGADSGELTSDPKPQGKVPFARSLPLSKANQPDVLLAYKMNGEDLPVAHGSPLRAVVPGWYGVASVKWLQQVIVTKRPFRGFFQTFDYSYFARFKGGMPVVRPITDMQVKAQIARPTAHEIVKAGSKVKIFGAAWTGNSTVSQVNVSTDGGQTWHEAHFLDKPVKFAWRLWEYTWDAPAKPGTVRLLARAKDARGKEQPLQRKPDRRNYLVTHVLPVEVSVK
jgi:DMSO/TMAO reductase YedYZ molybdopterin-dependent catalytic subunit